MSLEIEVAECFLVHLLLLCFRWRFILRWRNTRHKNPQLVAQHCFVARFCWLLPFFTLSDQLVAQQKHLLQVEESCCEKKSTGLLWATNFGFVAGFFFKLTTCPATNLLVRYKSTNQHATFLQPATSWWSKVENAKHRPKTYNETMLHDKLGVFVSRISPPLKMKQQQQQQHDICKENLEKNLGPRWDLNPQPSVI